MYHDLTSGLPNVWLVNGYQWADTAYGKAISFSDVEGLHRAIAQALIEKGELTGVEFRFFRRALDMSQGELGKVLGKSDQAVALWEKGRGAPLWAQRVLVGLYRESLGRPVRLSEIFAVPSVKAVTRKSAAGRSARMTFEKPKRGAWRLVEPRQRAAA